MSKTTRRVNSDAGTISLGTEINIKIKKRKVGMTFVNSN